MRVTSSPKRSPEALANGIRSGDTGLLARAVSLVENGRPGFEELLSQLHAEVGSAYRIGITGPPGAGKSTITERVTQKYRSRNLKVAVVAVDPTSPFSGGALLGDRIRMESVSLDPGVFIRSMASRGAFGGLATTTREVCDLLDAFGFDRIIVETVGVGQSELAITATADTAALILVPEGGNGIQVLKAGVMEIADLYVVNKADRTGADKLAREVQTMLGLRGGAGFGQPGAGHGPVKAAAASPTAKLDEGWVPPVLLTSAVNGKGITELVDALEAHEGYLKSSGELGQRRRSRLEEHTKEVVHRNVQVALWRSGAGAEILNREIERVVDGTRSPYDVANEIIESLLDGNK